MTGMLGFFTDGWREIGRKANRLGLRRRLAAKDRDRQQALTQLGQTAWQSKLDLSAFAEQRSRLEQLDARAGDLSATTARLDTQRTELQARRQAEVDRFDALLAPAKAAQSQADTTLRVARAALAEKDRAIRAIEAQLAGLGKELAKPGDRTSAQGATGGSGTAAPDAEQRDRIATQQKALTEQAAADAAARRGLADDVSARSAESQQCAAETARLDAERKAALQPIDADLEQLRQAAAAATQQRASVGREQEEAFCGLGAALYERRTGDPALNERVQAVAAVDADRTATQAAIDRSLALTSGMARGTMAKFGTLVLLIPVVLIAAGYAAYGRFESAAVVATPAPAKSAPPAIAAAALVAADERRKDEAVQAFMKAPTDPSRRKEGIEILLADVTALGSAADRSSLPLLGTILARGEPELRAAAANAVGMIGPTATEAAALTKALNDPMPAVRDKVLHALNQLKDPGARSSCGACAPRRARARGRAARDSPRPLCPTRRVSGRRSIQAQSSWLLPVISRSASHHSRRPTRCRRSSTSTPRRLRHGRQSARRSSRACTSADRPPIRPAWTR